MTPDGDRLGDVLLTTQEVADKIGASIRKVGDLKKNGKIQGLMIGGNRRYRRSEIDAFILKLEAEQTTEN